MNHEYVLTCLIPWLGWCSALATMLLCPLRWQHETMYSSGDALML